MSQTTPYAEMTIEMLDKAIHARETALQELRDELRRLTTARNRKLRIEHLVPLMLSTGRNPEEMTFEEMEKVAAAVKAGKEKSKQLRVSAGVADATGATLAPAK